MSQDRCELCRETRHCRGHANQDFLVLLERPNRPIRLSEASMTFSLPEVRALPRWSPCLFRDEGAVSGVKGAQTLISAAQDPNR